MELRKNLSEGDWLVHHHHGIGQLKGKKTVTIGGQTGDYFELELENGTIFVPTDNLNEKWFRAVVSDDTLTEVKEILGRPSQLMDRNFITRKAQIKTVMTDNSIVEIARIVRDLYGRRRRRKTLSSTEDSLLRKLEHRLLAEWTVADELDEGEAGQKLSALLVEPVKN